MRIPTTTDRAKDPDMASSSDRANRAMLPFRRERCGRSDTALVYTARSLMPDRSKRVLTFRLVLPDGAPEEVLTGNSLVARRVLDLMEMFWALETEHAALKAESDAALTELAQARGELDKLQKSLSATKAELHRVQEKARSGK